MPWLALLLLGTVAGTGMLQIEELPRDASHEVDGFSLHHRYTYSSTAPHRITKHRYRASFLSKFHATADDDALSGPEPFRDQFSKISTFLKMNTKLYPSERQLSQWWLQAAYGPLYDGNYTHFTGRPGNLSQEGAWREQQYRRYATSVGLTWPYLALPLGGPQDTEDIGVAISVYRDRLNKTTVIVFQGTYSYMNFEDIALWYGRDWIYYRWRELILHDWKDVLKLPVTGTMLQRGSGFAEWFYNGLLWHVMRHMRRRLALRISLMTRATPDDIDQQGYWPIIKRMMRDILPQGQASKELGTVYLTGHSKGGALASQVSMWLAKENGVRYQTYALEPTGYQCWIRRALGHDVDLGDPHPQIVTYRDALGHYSRLDFQVGRVYTYGAHRHRLGLEWCSAVVGFPGAQLFLRPSVALDAARCRYFHHDTHAMMYHLLRPDSPYRLSRRGVPVAHYKVEYFAGIPEGDQRCPDQTYGLDVGLLTWMLVFWGTPIFAMTLYCVWPRKPPRRALAHPRSHSYLSVTSHSQHGDG